MKLQYLSFTLQTTVLSVGSPSPKPSRNNLEELIHDQRWKPMGFAVWRESVVCAIDSEMSPTPPEWWWGAMCGSSLVADVFQWLQWRREETKIFSAPVPLYRKTPMPLSFGFAPRSRFGLAIRLIFAVCFAHQGEHPAAAEGEGVGGGGADALNSPAI